MGWNNEQALPQPSSTPRSDRRLPTALGSVQRNDHGGIWKALEAPVSLRAGGEAQAEGTAWQSRYETPPARHSNVMAAAGPGCGLIR